MYSDTNIGFGTEVSARTMKVLYSKVHGYLIAVVVHTPNPLLKLGRRQSMLAHISQTPEISNAKTLSFVIAMI